MLNVISWLWNKVTQDLKAAYHWVLNLIAAVYGYVNRLFDALGREVISVWQQFVAFAASVDRWVTHTVSWLINYIRSEATGIVHWAIGVFDDLRNYAIGLYHWTLATFDRIIGEIDAFANALVKWVIANIWNPLYGYIRAVFAWVDKYGVWLWDTVSNPEKLVAWAGAYLLRAWLDILKRWAVPLTRFIMRQMLGLAPDFVSLIEDVISRVL